MRPVEGHRGDPVGDLVAHRPQFGHVGDHARSLPRGRRPVTPPGGTAAIPENRAEGMREAVPPQRTGLEPLPQRVRGASGVTEADEIPEPVDEETLHRLLTGLREI